MIKKLAGYHDFIHHNIIFDIIDHKLTAIYYWKLGNKKLITQLSNMKHNNMSDCDVKSTKDQKIINAMTNKLFERRKNTFSTSVCAAIVVVVVVFESVKNAKMFNVCYG